MSSRRARLAAALVTGAWLGGASAAAGASSDPLRTTSLGGIPPSSASLLMVEAEGGDLTVAAFATPLAVSPGTARTLVVVEVAGADLLGDLPGEVAAVQLLVYAVRPGGEVVASLLEGILLDLDTLGDRLARGGIKLIAALDLPPGELSVRALVHNRSTGAFGLGRFALDVPAEPPVGPRLLAPVFGESSPGWVPLEPASAQARPDPRRLEPVLPGDEKRVAGHPVLVAGRPTAATALLFGFEGDELETAARLQSFDGGEPGRVRVEVEERLPAPHFGGELLRLQIVVEETPTGHQELRLAVRHPDGEGLLQAPPVRVLTLAQPVEAAHVAWPELGTLVLPDSQLSLAELVPFDPALLEHRELGSIRRADIRAAYCAGLHQLSAGNRGVALASLQTLESEVTRHNPRLRAHRILAAVQSELLFDLIRREQQAALPIILLHHDLFEDYQRHDPALALHAQNILRRLVASYLRIEEDEERRRAAVRVLVSVGGLRLREGVLDTAIGLFQEALRYDPENAVAALTLGTAFERMGEYREAVRALRPLVEAQPRLGEARLRLAVNLARTRHREEAIFQLREVIAGPGPEWAQAVAYQELASLLARRGRDEEAAAVLSEGIRRFPSEQPLRFQLARLEEERGDRLRADRLLEPLVDSIEGATWRNSRHRYNLWPVEGFRDERRRLREDSLIQLPRLARLMETEWGRSECPG